jgi:hypothetical protein
MASALSSGGSGGTAPNSNASDPLTLNPLVTSPPGRNDVTYRNIRRCSERMQIRIATASGQDGQRTGP